MAHKLKYISDQFYSLNALGFNFQPRPGEELVLENVSLVNALLAKEKRNKKLFQYLGEVVEAPVVQEASQEQRTPIGFIEAAQEQTEEDDFTLISGIGAKTNARLKELGWKTFDSVIKNEEAFVEEVDLETFEKIKGYVNGNDND